MAKHQEMSKKLLKGKEEKDISKAAKTMQENIMDGMDMDDYDNDENDAPIFTSELASMIEKEKQGISGKQKKPKKEAKDKDEDDEYMSDPDAQDIDMDDDNPSQYSDSSDEKEDFTIRKSDSLIVTATAENDHSSLEVYLYDHKNSDLYVHHEILLGSYPLCLEWLSKWQGEKTNHVIVGTFLPEIEIWNLDAESVEPTAILGSLEKSEGSKGNEMIKNYKKSDDDLGTHTEAVMCLSLNPI